LFDLAFTPDRAAGVPICRQLADTRGDVFHADGQGRDCLALSFANLSPQRIREGVALLGALVRRCSARGSNPLKRRRHR